MTAHSTSDEPEDLQLPGREQLDILGPGLDSFERLAMQDEDDVLLTSLFGLLPDGVHRSEQPFEGSTFYQVGAGAQA